MYKFLMSPPAAFIVLLAAIAVFSLLCSRLACRAPGKKGKGSGEPYACGESDYDHMAQPDYTTVFPYAFFFILAHVATLMMTTVPKETAGMFILAAMYIGGSALGLYILFRK